MNEVHNVCFYGIQNITATGPADIIHHATFLDSETLNIIGSTLYLIETPFNTFANRVDPDQAALKELPDQGLPCLIAYGNMIRNDPTLVDLTSNFFVLCTNAKVYLYNYTPRKLCLWWVYCFYYTPRKLCLWWVYCFYVVRPSVRPSIMFCFLNILKSHCWIFIKPCKHVHICKTNTLDKKVRARGQFY